MSSFFALTACNLPNTAQTGNSGDNHVNVNLYIDGKLFADIDENNQVIPAFYAGGTWNILGTMKLSSPILPVGPRYAIRVPYFRFLDSMYSGPDTSAPGCPTGNDYSSCPKIPIKLKSIKIDAQNSNPDPDTRIKYEFRASFTGSSGTVCPCGGIVPLNISRNNGSITCPSGTGAGTIPVPPAPQCDIL